MATPYSAPWTPADVAQQRVTPSTGWYGIAAAIAVVTTVISGLLLGSVIRDVFGTVSTFNSGGGVVVHLRDGTGRTLFVQTDTDSSRVTCSARALDGQPDPTLTQDTEWQLTIGGRHWQSLARVVAHGTGDVRISCTAPTPTEIGVGPDISSNGALRREFGPRAALAVTIGALGLIVALVIVIGVAVARNSSRQRLRSERPTPPAGITPYG